MADWEHKERNWSTEHIQMADGKYLYVRDLQRAGVIRDLQRAGFNGVQNFAAWLDMQCKDGWEVIKIARNFNPVGENAYGEPHITKSTWCVFRRKVD